MLSRVKVPGCLSNLDDDALTIADVSSDPPQLIRYVRRHGRVKTQRTKNVSQHLLGAWCGKLSFSYL